MAAIVAGAATVAQPVLPLTIIGNEVMLSNSSVVVAAPELRKARLRMLKTITSLRHSIGLQGIGKLLGNQVCIGRYKILISLLFRAGVQQFIYNKDE